MRIGSWCGLEGVLQPHEARTLKARNQSAGIEDSVRVESLFQAAMDGGDGGLQRVKSAAWRRGTAPAQRTAPRGGCNFACRGPKRAGIRVSYVGITIIAGMPT